ncbi:hypothetical protein CMU93_03075 [Elizabethkingia anophelis]|nr:hypothetical protein [Elizabethkingia anophelis]
MEVQLTVVPTNLLVAGVQVKIYHLMVIVVELLMSVQRRQPYMHKVVQADLILIVNGAILSTVKSVKKPKSLREVTLKGNFLII